MEGRMLTLYHGVALLVGFSCVHQVRSLLCLTENIRPYVKFGTFTDYTDAKAYIISDTAPLLPDDCRVIRLWYYGREGTRVPDVVTSPRKLSRLMALRDAIVSNHRNGKGDLCRGDLERLISWKPYKVEDPTGEQQRVPSGYLDAQGHYSLYNAAARYRRVFLNTLDPLHYTSENFQFLHGSSRRFISSKQSAISLQRGWNPDDSRYSFDPSFLFYSERLTQENCAVSYTDERKSRDQVVRFQTSYHFQELMQNVRNTLGFNSSLEKDDILLMYEACRSYKSLEPTKLSAWCIPFDTNDLKVFEYMEDLELYHTHGPATKAAVLNSACDAARNLATYFRSGVLDDNDGILDVKAQFVLTSAPALLRFLTLMDVVPDEIPLSYNNYDFQGNRRWQSSLLAPYGGHLLLALLKCGARHYVRAYRQEKVISVLDCNGLCEWPDFDDLITRITSKCRSCSSSHRSSPSAAVLALSLIAVIVGSAVPTG